VQPYWTDGQIYLYLGDCREVTAWLAADVLVTDPPYGRGAFGIDSTNSRRIGSGISPVNRPVVGDEDTSVRDYALEMWRGLGAAVVFGDLRIPAPAGTAQVLIYQKPPDAGYRSSLGFRRDAEAVYLLHVPAGYGGRSSIIRTNARTISNPSGVGARYGHPHAKPVDVLETLIAACPPGAIADPFCGSGSTLVAARNQGRQAVGVEIDERYAERAARRLDQGILTEVTA
jgi:site-specific DNA-methyltransferase (adenine-specific)